MYLFNHDIGNNIQNNNYNLFFEKNKVNSLNLF